MNNVMDITPVWEDIPFKDKLILEDIAFGNRIAGLGSPTVESVKTTQNKVDNIDTLINVTGWSSSLVFSSVDYDTVSWTAGDIYLKDGTTFSISAGNTGNMTATTYIYFDKSDNPTILKITTDPSVSVGGNKILVAVAQNNTVVTSQASFQVFGGAGGFMVTKDGIAAGTITGDRIAVNTINVNQITAGTFTGFTFQTASSGKRVEITAATNDLRIYDNTNQIVSLGVFNNAVLDMNLSTSGTLNSENGIDIRSSVGGVGYRYTNTSNVNNIGLIITQTGTTNNTNEAVRVQYAGSYYAQYIQNTDGGGLIMDSKGAGSAVYLLHDVNNVPAVRIYSSNYNSYGMEIENTGAGSGRAFKISNSGSQGGIRIDNYAGPAFEIVNSANYYTTFHLVDSTSVSTMYIEKTNGGNIINAYGNTTSSNSLVGMVIDLFNNGTGGAYAFQFYGNSIVNSSVGGSQNAKIKVRLGGTDYYIPVYTA